MLSVAREKIKMQGVKNFVIEIAEVSSLPFQDNIFDVVSCRYGFMFFPDMSLAAKEMVHVLKPGGKLVTAVWDVPEKKFWVTAIMKEKIKTEVTGLVNSKYPQDNIAIDACSRVIYGEKEG